MDGREFTRRVRDYARKTGLDFRFDPTRGKGSHGRVYLDSRYTTVKRGEISRSLLAAMLRQLGIEQRDF